MKYIIYSLIGLGLAVTLYSCKDKEPDPCSNLKPTSADFVILDAYLDETEPGSTDLVSDTICNKYATFSFTGIGDSLVWNIGLGTYNKKVVYIDFSNKPAYLNSLPIYLTVFNKKVNNSCFPTDNGKATKIRTLVFKDWHSSKIFGTWEGYNTDKPDSVFTIVIKDTFSYAVKHREIAFYVTNLVGKNKIWFFSDNVRLTFKNVIMGGCSYKLDITDTNIYSYQNRCLINFDAVSTVNNNSIYIDYHYQNYSDNYSKDIKRRFIGIRNK